MRIKKFKILLLLLMIINESFLYFFSSRNLTMIISVLGLVWGITHFRRIIIAKYYFKTVILTYLAINIVSVFYVNIKYGQPIVMGFKGIHWIFIFLLYFYFVDVWKSKDKKFIVEQVMEVIVWFSTIVAVISIVQVAVYPSISFLNVDIVERYGSYRFFSLLPSVIFGIGVNLSLIIREYSKKNMIYLFIQIIALLYVGKTRSVIIYIFISTILMLLASDNKITKRKFLILIFGTLLGVFGLIYLPSTTFYQNYFASIFNEVNNESGTIGTRLMGIDYYFQLFNENILFGIGRLVSEFEKTPLILGTQYSYYLGDLYYLGFIMSLGLIGTIWLLFYIYKMMKLASYYNNNQIVKRALLLFKITAVITFFLINDIDSKEYVLYSVMFMAIVEPYTSRVIKQHISPRS